MSVIIDEKARAIIKAWYDLNTKGKNKTLHKVRCYGYGNWIGLVLAINNHETYDIKLKCPNALEPNKYYTIDELCGGDDEQ